MGFGPVVAFDEDTTDVVAPGAPAFQGFAQVSNVAGKVSLQLPSLDSDGSPLTGLTHLSVATASESLAGKSVEEIAAVAGVVLSTIPVSDSEAGALKDVDVPVIRAGQRQFGAAWCDDNP